MASDARDPFGTIIKRMDPQPHIPVLLDESMHALALTAEGLYVDGTFGRGGHARAILARLGPMGRLVAVDRDPDAVAVGEALAARDARFSIRRAPFSRLPAVLAGLGLAGRVNGLLLDLGVSSPQLDTAERGFSFASDGPLDMRMDPDSGQSAAQWLATASETELARVLRECGEERFARRIAQAICRARLDSPLTTTRELARLVERVVPTREPGKHPATRTFQALRIHLNRELDELAECLAQVCDMLAAGGRLVVISFHSLEDRIVKRFIRDESRGQAIPKSVPVLDADRTRRLRPLGPALRPGPAEIARNPRARSAIMRVAERLP